MKKKEKTGAENGNRSFEIGKPAVWKKQYGKYAACILTGAILTVVVGISDQMGDSVRKGVLLRNPYGQGDLQYELLVDGLDEGTKQVSVTVPEQKMSDEEMRECFPEIVEELKRQILGENESLDHVENDLFLIKRLETYGLTVTWESSAPEFLGETGAIGEAVTFAGSEVILSAKLSNGSIVLQTELFVTVFPKTKTPVERFTKALEELVIQDDKKNEVLLPESFEGERLHYKRADQRANGGLFFLGIAAAGCLFLQEKSRIKEEKKRWQDRMLLDYPELLSNFLVLVGAGYPVRQAWKRQVLHAQKQELLQTHPVYREMQTTLNQMETGIPEVRAYGDFARRIGLGPYIKFASLLENSVSTGGKELKRLLEAEMETAFRQRKEIALRKGEEASTKLLIPMFLMLGVVMVMVAAPAFLSL